VKIFDSMRDLAPERRGWRLGLGIAMVILGVLTLGSTAVVGVLSVALLGVALLVGGVIALISAFRSGSVAEIILMIILVAMLLITGVWLLAEPVRGLMTITTLIATYLFLSGAARIVIALFDRRGNWGWAILGGVISLLLGVLIWAQWPVSGLVAVGLFIGIDLILIGISWIISALAKQPGQPADSSSRG
jgi:uncharacterized membrane protein HdeD (DUF308 family)